MELRQLKIFATVADEQSFTRAAQIMGYAQSNMTTQIRLLEEEFQVRLFERLGKRVALTSEGEKLLQHARQLLRYADEIKEIMTVSAEPSGLLTIGISESLCLFKFPSLLKEYSLRYPRVKLIIRQGTPADFSAWLRENQADVVFSLDRLVEEKDLICRILCEEPMIIAGSPDHPFTRKGFMELGDIAQESFIFAERNCSYRSEIEKRLSALSIRPASSYEFDNIEAIKQFVKNGLGIALLPLAAVEKELAIGTIADLKLTGSEFEMYTQVIHHKDKWISPALIALLDITEEYFREEMPTK
ncbi:MAG: LysR family transcriptional regulator [Deltaproteobacteria bacterium]